MRIVQNKAKGDKNYFPSSLKNVIIQGIMTVGILVSNAAFAQWQITSHGTGMNPCVGEKHTYEASGDPSNGVDNYSWQVLGVDKVTLYGEFEPEVIYKDTARKCADVKIEYKKKNYTVENLDPKGSYHFNTDYFNGKELFYSCTNKDNKLETRIEPYAKYIGDKIDVTFGNVKEAKLKLYAFSDASNIAETSFIADLCNVSYTSISGDPKIPCKETVTYQLEDKDAITNNDVSLIKWSINDNAWKLTVPSGNTPASVSVTSSGETESATLKATITKFKGGATYTVSKVLNTPTVTVEGPDYFTCGENNILYSITGDVMPKVKIQTTGSLTMEPHLLPIGISPLSFYINTNGGTGGDIIATYGSCSIVKTLKVNTPALTNLRLLSTHINPCPSASLIYGVDNSGAQHYEWQIIGGGSATLSSSTTTVPEVTVNLNTTTQKDFILRVRGYHGCGSYSTWASITVNVIQLNSFFVDISGEPFCKGDVFYGKAYNPTFDADAIFEWRAVGINYNVTTQNNIRTEILIPTDAPNPLIFNIRAIADGCTSAVAQQVNVYNNVTLSESNLNFPSEYCLDRQVDICVNSPQQGVRYEWYVRDFSPWNKDDFLFGLPHALLGQQGEPCVKLPLNRLPYGKYPTQNVTIEVKTFGCNEKHSSGLVFENTPFKSGNSIHCDKKHEIVPPGGNPNDDDVFHIKILPNPASDAVTIEIPEADGSMANIKITDVMGTEKKNIDTYNLIETINISDLNPGAYNVIVIKGDNMDAKHLQVLR